MSAGRILLLLVVLGVGYWLYKSQIEQTSAKRAPEATGAPIDRARDLAREADRQNAEAERLKREADSGSPAGTVTENMTPDQVRALLGPPDEVISESTDSGVSRERWIYRRVGKTVVFENGIAISVQ
jgi:hypothetical protein